MIILDTNIISELMKPEPDSQLLSWLNQQASELLYITSISIAEIMYGLAALPPGKRRLYLEQAFNQVILEAFNRRSLPFGDGAAKMYGKIMATCKEAGRCMSVCDGQIAAITLFHGGQLATRNIKDFQACKVSLLNPFQ